MTAAAPKPPKQAAALPSGERPTDLIPPGGEAYATLLETRRVELATEKEGLDKRDARLSTIRGFSFVATLVLLGLALFGQSSLWIPGLVVFAAFLAFVVAHALTATRQLAVEQRIETVNASATRLREAYAPTDPGICGDAFVEASHPYASDLDLFGRHSLFAQLNAAHTDRGRARLASWLRNPAAADEIRARQAAAQEVAADLKLREDFAFAGLQAASLDRDADRFIAWAQKAPGLPSWFAGVVTAGALLSVATWTQLIMAAAGNSNGRFWLATSLALLLLTFACRGIVEPIVGPVVVKAAPLGRWQGLIASLENAPVETPWATARRERLTETGGGRASEALQRLDRIVGYAAIRHNPLGAVILNGLFPWDLASAYVASRWQKQHGAHVSGWLESLADMEALISLGSFAAEHPTFTFPNVDEAGPPFSSSDLGHPLIHFAARVHNPCELSDGQPVLLVTGSNMSGKSTYLRAIGINAVLALAGAPVCSQKLDLRPVRLHTSIQLADALSEGASHFFAEVRRLKSVVDLADDAAKAPVLFLLDEVLHGTNSRERNIGAKAVVRHLVTRGAIGAVSSHDLGLVELAKLTEGKVVNRHFSDHIEEGTMKFDYRVKDGPVATSNALRLMRAVGIDVAGLNDAPSAPASDDHAAKDEAE